MRCRPSSSWHLFLLLHAPKQFQRMNSLETIIEEPNEATVAQNKSEHRCQASKTSDFTDESVSKTKEEILIEGKVIKEDNTDSDKEKNISSEQKERSRKQWETSPDQMKEISKSLSQINGSHLEKRDQQLIRSKRSTNDKLIDNQINRSTLPPINSFSDSDSGKELIDSCICEGMYKSSGDLLAMDNSSEPNQWVVSRPIRNKPKDNLRLEGPMELETTFKSSYDSTAKQINENLSKNVAVVMPSNKLSSDEMRKSKINELNTIKASKKKPKHRPSTSLKAGGDGYFSTINKESYKNFVIIDDKSKVEKSINSSNGKKTSAVCCSTVSNIKLPKVDSNNREEHNISRRKSREEKSTQIEGINRSMQRLTTSDRYEAKNVSQKTQTNGNMFVDSSVQTNNHNFNQTNGTQNDIYSRDKSRDDKTMEKTSLIAQQKAESEHRMTNELLEANTSWTVGGLEEHKRLFTRDVDSIKELGLLDLNQETNEDIIREIQRINEIEKQMKATNDSIEKTRNSNRIRIESKHYVQTQRRQKKHKNESSMKLFNGDMDFTTTTRTCYSDKSPNRGDPQTKRVERERTAGKRSRKSGRKRNLFRTSTEADFFEPYRQYKVTETTYQKQFGDRLYCPAIDLGSNKSDFKYRGEASGHKFFLPAVNN